MPHPVIATPVATPPAVPAGPEGSGGAPPGGNGATPTGETGKGATPPTPKYRYEKMAAEHPAGEIEKTAAIQDAYAPLIGEMAGRLEGYARSGGALTEEQSEFLKLYHECLRGNDTDFKGIIATESGFQAVHVMLETEMMLRLIAFGRDLAIHRQGVQPTPISLNLDLPEYAGWLRRLGRDTRGVLSGLFGWLGLDPMSQASFDLTALAGIDITRLPPQYQEYIQHLQGRIDERSVVQSIFDTAEAYKTFYEAYGVDFRNLNAITPWHRLNLTADEPAGLEAWDFSQNVIGDWNNFRLDRLRALGFFGRAITAGEKLELFFRAQRETIAEFTKRRLAEISTKPERLAQSIGLMQDMIGEIRTGEAPARLKKRREEQLADRNKERDRLRQERDKAQYDETSGLDKLGAQIREIDGQRTALTTRLTTIGTELTAVIAEQSRIAGIYADIDRRESVALTGVRDKEEKPRISAPFNREREAHRAEERAANEEVSSLTAERKAINTTLTKTYPDLVAKRDEKQARITQIDTVLIPDLDTEIEHLEYDLHVGVATGDRERIGRFEAAIRALTRHEDATGELHDSAKVGEYNLAYFTDTNPDADRSAILGGAPAPRGYTRIIELIFDPDHPPKGTAPVDFWRRIRELFPEDELARVLVEAFHLTLPVGGGTPLEIAFAQMQAARISPISIKESFIQIIQRIERRGTYN